MISGIVNGQLEATISLTLFGPHGQLRISAVIDTGYNGALTLPAGIVAALGLLPLAARTVTLADATRRVCDYYDGELDWDGQQRRIRVLCLDGDPLVGTSLLSGFGLSANFAPGGSVSIQKLP